MSEEEEFQYVVSKEDYSDFKTSQAKCQQLSGLLTESQNLHFQDKQKYLFKIDQLQDELKAYKSSIRLYVEKQVREVDNLLKMIHDYKSVNSKSSIDPKTLLKMKSQCDQIAQTFTLSLQNLELLNSELINLFKTLTQDSLALHQKLKECSQRQENGNEERETLYVKVRQLNEKTMFLEKEKEKLAKSEQKLIMQSDHLQIKLQQKQDQYTQHKISCESVKSKLNSEIKGLNDELALNEKKWRERLETAEKKLQKDVSDLRNEKLLSTKTLIEEIKRLTDKIESLTQQSKLKQNKINQLQVAYKQQSALSQKQTDQANQKHAFLAEQLQIQTHTHQKLTSNHQTEINSLTSAFDSKLIAHQQQISALQTSLAQKTQLANNLSAELNSSNSNIAQLHLNSKKTINDHLSEKTSLLQTIDQRNQQIQQKSLQIASWEQKLQILKNQLQDYAQKYQLQAQSLENHQQQHQSLEKLKSQYEIQSQSLEKLKAESLQSKNIIKNLSKELFSKNEQIQLINSELFELQQKTSHQIEQLRSAIAICETEKTILEDNAKSLTQQLLNLQKSILQEKNKLRTSNQQLSSQIQTMDLNLNKRTIEFEELHKAYADIKSAKNYAETQFFSLKQTLQKEKKKHSELKEKLAVANNECSIMRQTFEQSQISNESLLKEIEELRNEIRSSRQVEEASHLLKMNANTLQTEVERLRKENSMNKKDRQLLCQETASAKEEIKFLNDDLNSMKLYIDELEQNLQKLSEEKAALKNQLNLFKEEAEFCKQESIDQLKIIDQLERQVQNAKKELKNAEEMIDPSSIVRRSSLSKGEKSYYVKEMIHEYSNEMKKNLDEIGALSPEEVKDLIFSELRELGNFLKKLEKDFE